MPYRYHGFMPARPIVELGNPLLREISLPVTDFGYAAVVLDDLASTLHEFQKSHGFGRGIAAIQIGERLRIIYIEINGQRFEILNPIVISRSAECFELWDDCFSFPNLMVQLERHRGIDVAYQDRNGHKQVLSAVDDFSELLQHEIDHLDGVLAIDRAIDPKTSFMTRSEFLRRRAP
jgi:peptide deformylase